MASALQHYHQLADYMATQITASFQSWTDFLTTATRLYKYQYHEQLMIYAQRPDVTVCAEYNLGNKRIGRHILSNCKFFNFVLQIAIHWDIIERERWYELWQPKPQM